MRFFSQKFLILLGSAFINTALLVTSADACTRVLFVGSEGVVITGRSMDWEEDVRSNMWIMPRGVQRNGEAGPNSIKWTSHYGSVIVTGYDVGTADGMNEKGLVANILYLAESDYGHSETAPKLSISLWGQYVLDNFATVSEAVDALSKNPFQIIAPTLPNGSPAQLHLSISDSSGDSAIFEYVNGKLVIHHGKQYKVMTNSPTFDQQLALDSYWQSISGSDFLPGTSRPADRFARASFFINGIPEQTDPNFIKAVPEQNFDNQAIASVTSVIRSVSVPLGTTTPGKPNVASTLWRTIADQKNKRYFFDSATSPNIFWVDLSKIDFREGAPIKKLQVAGGMVYSGDVSSLFKPAVPFKFLSSP